MINPHESCDDSSRKGYSRLTQRFILETAVRSLLNMTSSLVNHSFSSNFSLSDFYSKRFRSSTPQRDPSHRPLSSTRTFPAHKHPIHFLSDAHNFTKERDLVLHVLRSFAILLEPGHYVSFPSVGSLMSSLSHLAATKINRCAVDTFPALLLQLERERDTYRRKVADLLEGTAFLKTILGKSVQNRIEHYPMDPHVASKRL
jgi:hypothetical protein